MSFFLYSRKKLSRSDFVFWIFDNANLVSGLSEMAVSEIVDLGINSKKVKLFTYWIDLKRFKVEGSKKEIKQKLGWKKDFVVLFVLQQNHLPNELV